MLRFAHLLFLAALLASCGGTQLDRLANEPEGAEKLTLPVTRRTHPAVDGVQRFIAAMQTDDAEKAWVQLSSDTRKAMQAKAAPLGLRGTDLLRLGKMPVGETMASAVPMDFLALFAVRGVKTLRVLPPPDKTPPEQPVELTGKNGTRIVTLRFEGYAWRLHQPDLAMPELHP